MDHSEYVRYIPGSRVAVLMIHGIAGSPGHFRDLLPLIPEEWSVYNILLAGHGGTVLDFGKTSMREWKQQVTEMLTILFERHEQVVMVGHSMGTLFSIQSAIDHPDRIPILFLLNAPLRIHLPLSTMIRCLKVAWGSVRPESDDWAMAQATSIRMTRRLWEYVVWVPRLVELLADIAHTRRILSGLRIPAWVFQSRRDELVSLGACRDLEKCEGVSCRILEDSTHFRYGPEDIGILRDAMKRLISEVAR